MNANGGFMLAGWVNRSALISCPHTGASLANVQTYANAGGTEPYRTMEDLALDLLSDFLRLPATGAARWPRGSSRRQGSSAFWGLRAGRCK